MTLSPFGDSLYQEYTKALASFSTTISCNMPTPNSGSAGNGAGAEIFDVPGNLGSISEIQHELTVLSRQMGQLALRLTYRERQREEESVNATTMQVAQKAEEEQHKEREVQK